MISILAKGGYSLLEEEKQNILNNCGKINDSVLNTLITLIQNDFPRSSLPERMEQGTLLKFLQNARPDLEGMLSVDELNFIGYIERILAAHTKE